MKVLWFSNTPANSISLMESGMTGGGWLQSLDQALQEHVNLHVAFFNPEGGEPFRYKKTTYHSLHVDKWKWHLLKQKLFGFPVKRISIPKCLEVIEEVQPDIIHIHGTEGGYLGILEHVTIPVVVSIQGIATVCHHKFPSGLSNRELKQKKAFSFAKSLYFRQRKLEEAKNQELQYMPLLHFVIGRTDWDRRVVKLLAPDSKYYHGEELLRDVFFREQWIAKNEPAFNLHTTTNGSPYKGFETLCLSLKLLLDWKVQVKWTVAGLDENDGIVKIVKKRLGSRFPKTGLQLLGKLPPNELVQRMKEADIYVLTSHIENSSNSLCEAMLLGMPCIGTYAGGTPSLLKTEEEGILVQDGDPWALAGAVLALFDNWEKAVAFGYAARTRALQRHDSGQITSSMLEIYEDVINRSQ